MFANDILWLARFGVFRLRGNCWWSKTVTWEDNLLCRHLLSVSSCLLLSEIKKPTVYRVVVLFTWSQKCPGSTSVISSRPQQKFFFRSKKWLKWCQEFRRFRSASKLTEVSGETQRDSLLYIMGSESEKIFQNLVKTVIVGEDEDARVVHEMDTDFDT